MAGFREKDVPAILAFARDQARRLRAARRALRGELERARAGGGAHLVTLDGIRWFSPESAEHEIKRLSDAVAFYERAIRTAEACADATGRATMLSAVWFVR